LQYPTKQPCSSSTEAAAEINNYAPVIEQAYNHPESLNCVQFSGNEEELSFEANST
jgi:hypothetical protein